MSKISKEGLVKVHDIFISHIYRLLKSRGIDREIKKVLEDDLFHEEIEINGKEIVPKKFELNSYKIVSTKAHDLDIMGIKIDTKGSLIISGKESPDSPVNISATVEVIFDLVEDKWEINIKEKILNYDTKKEARTWKEK